MKLNTDSVTTARLKQRERSVRTEVDMVLFAAWEYPRGVMRCMCWMDREVAETSVAQTILYPMVGVWSLVLRRSKRNGSHYENNGYNLAMEKILVVSRNNNGD